MRGDPTPARARFSSIEFASRPKYNQFPVIQGVALPLPTPISSTLLGLCSTSWRLISSSCSSTKESGSGGFHQSSDFGAKCLQSNLISRVLTAGPARLTRTLGGRYRDRLVSQRALTLDEIILRHAPKPRLVKADVLADSERSRPPAGKFKTQLDATGRRASDASSN